MRTRKCLSLIAIPVALLLGCSEQTGPTAGADNAALDPAAAKNTDVSCARRVNNTAELLMSCVTLDGVRRHQAALQAIADANGGTRVSGAPGFNASKDYVVGLLEAAGYDVVVQPFQFQTFITLTPTLLEQVSPAPSGQITTRILSYSGSGNVTAPVSVPSGIFGCVPADFAGFPAGNIALIRRGTDGPLCTFAIKTVNAVNAGAVGVVIYNNQSGELNGTLSSDFTLDIPAVAVSEAVGQELVGTPGLVLRVQTNTLRGAATSYNVLAETRSGNPDHVVMVGAHLDAVNAGPGINDNGSAVGAVLETALQMARVAPANRVRFAFWGAKESSLVGSTFYVNSLSVSGLDRIAMYLNFDMIGSPNYGFFVYDGDDSDAVGAGAGPEGSAAIEALFNSFYAGRGLTSMGTDLSGRSDYGPFVASGIPAGGLFSGAEELKTAAQAAMWGGTAGIAFDPCYHLACDTYDNVNTVALDVNSDAVAFATLKSAMDGSMSKRGKRNPKSGAAAPVNEPSPTDR